MTAVYCQILFAIGCPRSCAVTTLLVVFLIVSISSPCLGQSTKQTGNPRVLMLELHGSVSSDDGLYNAISGQLSASSLILKRFSQDSPKAGSLHPQETAAMLASAHQAALVFWIEQSKTSNIFFYIPNNSGGHIYRRTVDSNLSSQPSRFEEIAVVVSSTIEGFLVASDNSIATPTQKQNPSSGLVNKENAATRKMYTEIHLAYAGTVTAPKVMSHGAMLGLGYFLVDHLQIGVSFTRSLPLGISTEDVRLKIITRQIVFFAAARISIHPVDIRLGIAWALDLRSFSTTPLSPTIAARPAGLKGVHSLVPFVLATWFFSQNFGIFGRLGAGFALNETMFRVNGSNNSSAVFEPYAVKLAFQLGLVIQL